MIELYKKAYQRLYKQFFIDNPFTWVYGLSRTILAICILSILTFSDTTVLFDEAIYRSRLDSQVFSSWNLFYLFGWEGVVWSKILGIALLLIIVTGWRPRYTGIIQWWITISFFHSSSIVEGGDQIAVILTFLLIPVTLLDHRKWHWDKSEKFAWPQKFIANLMFVLISVQMAMVYLNAATDKIYVSDEWKVGSAFYYYVNDAFFSYPRWMDPLMEGLLTNSFFVSAISWGTILLELVLFGMLFSKFKNRRLLFPVAVGFHFGIVVFLGLVSFFFAMLGGLLLYLIPKDCTVPKIAFKKHVFDLRSFVSNRFERIVQKKHFYAVLYPFYTLKRLFHL